MLFIQWEKQQWQSIFKNVVWLKDNDFAISAKIISEHIHGWYIQKVAKAFNANTVLYFLRLISECKVGKNCQKPGKLVSEPFCSFNKLTGSDEYLYEHDRLECHKSMTIEVRW